MPEIITKEQLEDASIDAKDLGECVHGNETGIVTPRLGDPYPTLPAAIQTIIGSGGFEPFTTETALLASTPTSSKQAALALDTENLFFWDGLIWILSGSIALNSAVMISLIASYDPALVYKGKANLNASAPSSPVANDTYIVVSNGASFGVQVQSGQLLIYTGTNWKVGDMLEVFNRKFLATGGNGFLTDKNTMPIAGYINAAGSFVASGAGFKLSYFKPVSTGQTLKFSMRGSASANVISFWDANMVFISGVLGNDSNVERTVIVPVNAVYVRTCNVSTANLNPYCRIDIKSILDSADVLKTADMTVDVSLNLARSEYIVSNTYVNSSGGLTAGTGWKHIKIPVLAGNTYAFGNFAIDSGGYYTFFNSSNAQIAAAFGSYSTASLPKVLIAPAGAAYLLFDIARPTNLPEHYAQVMCNLGGSLLEYVEPIDTITAIEGKKIAGSGGGPLPDEVIIQGGNATLADIIADSVTTSALIANLPTSSTGLEVGQAYIDVDTVKVVI
ncbi:hypothetical protein GWP85_16940 [Acinetobacter beijerinckii]|uniref:hypothetical protein n=1 Tax=Acinetobacter beijerinckii TaxID=262668 RepID=UPI0023DD8930|nr:hypothetical protein [Acinetobacter beijerinckii]MDF2419179.1 hypothetical protein [Acinetobacter beijerinckii]